MENPFAEALKGLDYPNHRKLSFEEQCAFFAALKCGVPQLAVAHAGNVSRFTASLLSKAGTMSGGQLRYPAVASEYATHGHEGFVHKYLTPIMRERVLAAMEDLRHRERNPPLNAKGYNPNANRHCNKVIEWPETSIGLHAVFVIELVPDLCGYLWRNLKPHQGMPTVDWSDAANDPRCQLQGDPSRGPRTGPGVKGFPTSQACFAFVKRELWPTEAQMAEDAA